MLVRAVGISLLCMLARCFNAKFSAVNTASNVLDGLENLWKKATKLFLCRENDMVRLTDNLIHQLYVSSKDCSYASLIYYAPVNSNPHPRGY